MQQTITLSCHDDPRSVFVRLADHLRLVMSGIVLLMKLAPLAAMALVWMNMADGVAYRLEREDTFAGVMAISALTIVLIQGLATHLQRRIVLTVGAALMCAIGLGLLVLWMRSSWEGQQAGVFTTMLLCAVPVALGAALGHLAASGARALAGRLAVPAGQIAHLVPTLGLNIRGESYRAEVDAVLISAEQSLARGLASTRAIIVGGLAIVLPAVAWSWAMDWTGQAGISVSLGDADSVLWLIAGACIGAISGITLMPARKRYLIVAIPISIATLMSTGAMAAIILRGRMPMPPSVAGPCAVIVGTALIATTACVATRFVAGFVVTRILPSFLRAHLTGNILKTTAPLISPSSALSCEICGYHLEGLPIVRCDMCATDELRCPECGHQQPADVMHARGLLRVYKLHTAIRVISWLAALPAAGLLLFPWFVFGMEFGGRGLFGGIRRFEEVVILLLVSFVLIAPLRLMMMHWRPMLIQSLFLPAVPLVAMVVGGSLSRNGGVSPELVYFVPGWIVISVLVPGLWLIWLWFIYGRSSIEVFRWHISPAYRHRDAQQISSEAPVIGKELPANCVCGAQVPRESIAPCPACGVLAMRCESCQMRKPISLARIGYESLVHRARQMLLAMLAASAGIATGIVGLIQFGSVSQWRYASMQWSQLADFCLLSLLAGALLRLVLLRRPPIIATLLAPAIVAGVYALGAMLFSFERGYAGESSAGVWLANLAINIIAALLGSTIAVPLLTLAARILLLHDNARALMAWLTGRITMDDACRWARNSDSPT